MPAQKFMTFAGNGFVAGDTTVLIGNQECANVTVQTKSALTCITKVGAAGRHTVRVTSNGQLYNTSTFEYSTMATPTVTAISPDEGNLK